MIVLTFKSLGYLFQLFVIQLKELLDFLINQKANICWPIYNLND